jgi:hypothetical protein
LRERDNEPKKEYVSKPPLLLNEGWKVVAGSEKTGFHLHSNNVDDMGIMKMSLFGRRACRALLRVIVVPVFSALA